MQTITTVVGVTNYIATLRLSGIIALVLGVLILIFPKLLNRLVAAYLIIIGVISVFHLHL